MNKLYQKSETTFSILWIVVYVTSFSIADNASEWIGIPKLITVGAGILLSLTAFFWIRKNQLFQKYGLCRPAIRAKHVLYYIPLAILASCNLWHGVSWRHGMSETILYILSMLSVGFLEEVIFRGFLFKAMCRDNVRSAIIVSSITFGIGHIVNLFNGSGMELLPNILQVCNAIVIGFLFTILFYKGKSLIPCILTHGVLNSLSIFANEQALSPARGIVNASAVCAISGAYLLYLLKKVLDAEDQDNDTK